MTTNFPGDTASTGSSGESAFLIFEVGGHLCAVSVDAVREIVFMAELARVPGQPPVLEGFLNLRGTAVPVLRLDRLFDLPPAAPGLYSSIVILRGGDRPAGLLAARAEEVGRIPGAELQPIDEKQSFNGCARARFTFAGRTVHALSAERVMLAAERRAVEQLREREQRYLDELEAQPQ